MNNTDSDRVGPMLNPPQLGELIRESMDEVGWNVTETAARLGCERGTLSRLLNGKAGVSANMALALEAIGWGTADHWMRMQASYELAQAELFLSTAPTAFSRFGEAARSSTVPRSRRPMREPDRGRRSTLPLPLSVSCSFPSSLRPAELIPTLAQYRQCVNVSM